MSVSAQISAKHEVVVDLAEAQRCFALGVAEGPVAAQAFGKHPGEHRHLDIDIVIDADLTLGRMQSVNSTGVLDESALPRLAQGRNLRTCLGPGAG